MESDAEAEETNATVLDFGVVLLIVNQEIVLNRHILIGSLDGMLAIAAIVEAGAYMLAKETTSANLPSDVRCGSVLIFEIFRYLAVHWESSLRVSRCRDDGACARLLGDEEEVGADAKLCERSEDVIQLVAVVDTDEDGQVEIGRCGTVGGKEFVADVALGAVPHEIGMDVGRDLTKAHVEAVGDAVADTDAESGVLSHIIAGQRNLIATGQNRVQVIIECTHSSVEVEEH